MRLPVAAWCIPIAIFFIGISHAGPDDPCAVQCRDDFESCVRHMAGERPEWMERCSTQFVKDGEQCRKNSADDAGSYRECMEKADRNATECVRSVNDRPRICSETLKYCLTQCGGR